MPVTQPKSPIQPRPTRASMLRTGTPGAPKKTANTDEPVSEAPKPTRHSGARATEGVRAFMAQQRARISARQTPASKEVEAPPRRVMTGATRYSSGPDVSHGEAFGQPAEKSNLKLSTVIRQAKSSGKLNISGRELERLPEEVLTMYEVDPNSIVVDFTSAGNAWYDEEVLTKFIAADNSLAELDERIGTTFLSLTLLDLRHNCLSRLPASLAQLKKLTVLQLPYNKFETVPECVLELKQLKQLYIDHNQISTLSSDIAKLAHLETLDLSNNQLSELPDAICELATLSNLNLDNNRLTQLPSLDMMGHWTKLNELTLSQNKVETLFRVPSGESVSLPSLSRLSACNNRLKHMTSPEMESSNLFVSLPKLKELSLTHNSLSSLAIVEAAPEMETLNIGSNQFSEIPDAILTLQRLKRLDVSLNQLQDLRPDLVTLSELQTITWHGNKLRSVPKNITMTDLMDFLREKLVLHENETSVKTDQGTPDKERQSPQEDNHEVPVLASPASPTPAQSSAVKERKSLTLSRLKLDSVSEELIQQPPIVEVTSIDLSHNLLPCAPLVLSLCADTLVSLDLSHNRITEFPALTCVFGSLKSLNLSNNTIKSVGETSSFPVLRELNLCHNRIDTLPETLGDFLPSLSILRLASNKLDAISATSFQHLEILDLSCNDISRLPPELGLIKTIKDLELHGNKFRIPRPALLSQGTQAVMEFLSQRANPAN